MKYILLLADGMADEPLEELNGLTPMESASTPNMDKLAQKAEIGMVKTVPDGMSPGSDTANLSVLGYDPRKYYTGRSPLEALSIGAEMSDGDVSFRVNMVTLSDEEPYQQKKMLDHSAGEITTEESAELLHAVRQQFEKEGQTFYKGVSYRHAFIKKEGSTDIRLVPPHNILGQTIGEHLPEGIFADELYQMMERSYEILKGHPVNQRRIEKGMRPANSIWIWGQGTKPHLPKFEQLYKKKGAMISAVDLLKGIAIGAEMKSIDVEGATGTIDTNYQGKVDACLQTLNEGSDFVYLHVEAPDECGHQGDLKEKIHAIELFDEKVVGPIVEGLKELDEPYSLLILPDHPTPVSIRTHTDSPVPYLMVRSNKPLQNGFMYNEKDAKTSGYFVEEGYLLMERFLAE